MIHQSYQSDFDGRSFSLGQLQALRALVDQLTAGLQRQERLGVAPPLQIVQDAAGPRLWLDMTALASMLADAGGTANGLTVQLDDGTSRVEGVKTLDFNHTAFSNTAVTSDETTIALQFGLVSDIQPTGAVASAGSTGRPADAGHVHVGGSAALTATQVGFGSPGNLLTGSPHFTFVSDAVLTISNTAGANINLEATTGGALSLYALQGSPTGTAGFIDFGFDNGSSKTTYASIYYDASTPALHDGPSPGPGLFISTYTTGPASMVAALTYDTGTNKSMFLLAGGGFTVYYAVMDTSGTVWLGDWSTNSVGDTFKAGLHVSAIVAPPPPGGLRGPPPPSIQGIPLNSTRTLDLKMLSNVTGGTQLTCQATYVDITNATGAAAAPVTVHVLTNDTSWVTVVGSPGATVTRYVTNVLMKNISTTTNTSEFDINNGGSRTLENKSQLVSAFGIALIQMSVEYDPANGWRVHN